MRLLNKFFPILLILFFAFLYVHNLSRSVYGGDVGDFVTTAAIGGVAHAPGYPIFVFVGFLLIHLLPFFTPAFAMGLISAAAGVGGILVVYLLVKQLTKSVLSGSVAALTLGFSYLFWFYSEIAEVFALHAFFVLVLFYLAILFDKTRKRKWFFWFAFTIGMAAITHQSIVLFVPSYLIILFKSFWKSKKKVQMSLIGLGLFFLPWLSYIYVFIASSHHPAVNWDNVHDLKTFLQLVLRKDYGTFKAGLFPAPVWAQRIVIVKTYLFTVLNQVTIPVLLLSAVGFWGLLRTAKRYAIAFLLAFFIAGPVFVTYAGFPLEGTFFLGVYERFFTMSTLPLYFLFGYGVFLCAHIFQHVFSRRAYFPLLHVIFLLIPLQLFVYNMPKTDLSHVYVGDTLGKDFLTPLPHGSILLLSGDTSLFNTWYAHYALHVRPDIRLINLSMISMDPYILEKEKEIKKTNSHIKGNELVAKTLQEVAKSEPIFSHNQLQAPGKTNLTWVPTGLVYRLAADANPEPKEAYLAHTAAVIKTLHLPQSTDKNYRNLTIAEVPQIYAKSLWSIGNYLFNTYKDGDNALVYYKKALEVDPTYENAYTTIGLVYLSEENGCQQAQDNFQKAIEQTPYDEFPYFLLYTTYAQCFHDKTKTSVLVRTFHKQFKKDFYQELLYTLKDFKLK